MSDTTTQFPLVMTAAGPVPAPPATLNAQLIAIAQGLAPGLTANLPAALIEDVSSTATGALIVIDQERVDEINSLSPFAANLYLLTQLGTIYGVEAGQASNPSVYVVFTQTAATGFVIPPGFTVSDGTSQYVVQDGGAIGSGGASLPLFALATTAGPGTIPADTVTQFVTSVPPGVTLSVTNPLAGQPGGPAQAPSAFRAAVLQAGLAAAQGMPDFVKALVMNVPGVQANLVSMSSPSANRFKVIVGGSADPIQIGYAIYQGIGDVSTLVGSTISITAFTAANPGVVTTNLNHGYATGQVVVIAGCNPGAYNGTYTITVTDEKTFSIGVDSSGFGSYTGGGVVTPDFRNQAPTINSYPDSFVVPFVVPPVQTVTMTATWNTSSLMFVSPTGVAQLVQPAVAAYINALPVGAPINLLELNDAFIQAVAPILREALITRLVWTVYINTVETGPGSGTQTIFGDPESYFLATAPGISVIQG